MEVVAATRPTGPGPAGPGPTGRWWSVRVVIGSGLTMIVFNRSLLWLLDRWPTARRLRRRNLWPLTLHCWRTTRRDTTGTGIVFNDLLDLRDF